MNFDKKNLIILLFSVFTMPLFANGDKVVLLNLSGNWKFSIGDNKDWAQPEFDDNAWETIKVPSAWEDQGYYGYDGYAWYRTSFNVTKEMKNKELFLVFGYIGDVDQVFLNGKLIGFSGSFPPEYYSSPDAKRKYPIPAEYLNLQEKNVISVRVYNNQMEGGIVSGEVGIISYVSSKPDISLAGMWLFKTGDNDSWKEVKYQDKHWKKIVVPGSWKNQGFKDYNGTAWYRKQFTVPKDYENQKLVLLLGKVNDADEVYINGTLIGSSDDFARSANKIKKDETTEQQKLKFYVIPDKLLNFNKFNIIAVKLFNDKDKGGLVDGPVGFVKSINFVKFQKEYSIGESE